MTDSPRTCGTSPCQAHDTILAVEQPRIRTRLLYSKSEGCRGCSMLKKQKNQQRQAQAWKDRALFVCIVLFIAFARAGLLIPLVEIIQLQSSYKRVQYIGLIMWATLFFSYDGRRTGSSLLFNFVQVAPSVFLAAALFPTYAWPILVVNFSALVAVNFFCKEPSIHRTWLFKLLK